MKTVVYAARHKDKDILMKSSTGGMFTAISDYFLNGDGAVVCTSYNYSSNQAEFQLFTDKESRNKARGSMYMQSKPLNLFKEAEKWLKNNNENLLFIGMGCQADGFRKFAEIKKLRDRVTIVGIICHGSPSPKLWREYVSGNIDYVTFKDKRNGWEKPTAVIVKEGNEKSISDYIKIFYNGCALRPACYECPYSTTEREVDMTIGDYWGIDNTMPDFYSPNGNALILVHTEKGMDLWNNIKNVLEWRESNTIDCLQPNLIKPTNKSPVREEFWKDYERHGIDYIMKKYGTEPVMIKIRNKVKKIWRKQSLK